MKHTNRIVFFIAAIVFCSAALTGSPTQIPKPEEFFGHKPGADFNMLRWDKIHEYFQILGDLSERIEIHELGKTTLGNPFILAVISSPENLARLDDIRETARTLASGRIPEEEAFSLSAESKTIALITCSMHATESGPTQMSPLLGYTMATDDSPRIRKILDEVVFLFVPCFNPDGNILVVDWYRKNLGTPFETARMPWLYHHYVGHDNNRDGFMLTQVETQYVTQILYRDWFPQMLLDMHHMGNSDARLFLSPMYDPRNPSLDPLVTREIELTGAYMRTSMEERDLKGIIHYANWNGWWQAATFTNAWWHNVVSILFEAAGTPQATPIYQTARDLTGSYSGGLGKQGNYQQMNYPSPWPGGWWRMSDIVEYAYWACLGFLESGAKHREKYLKNMYRMAHNSIERGKSEAPYAYIVPMTQKDPNTAAKMLNIFIDNGAEIHQATAPFEVENRRYPAGTYVILMSQAYRPFLMDMLGPQKYPERRKYSGGPPELPFDLTGWTLAYQMDVETVEVPFPFEAALKPVTRASAEEGDVIGGGNVYIFDHSVLDTFRAVNRLLAAGHKVYWATKPFNCGGKRYPAGAVIASGSGISRDVMNLAEEFHLHVRSGNLPTQRMELKPLRMGLYQPWTASMDEGWNRWIFDTWEFPYTTIHDAEIRNGNLKANYDVILLSSIPAQSIIEGNQEGMVPSVYAGGIGNRGLGNLIRFVKDGGTLITLDASSQLAIDHFQIPVRNLASDFKPERFFCPGSLLKTEVDNTHPIGYGMDRETILMFSRSPFFQADPEEVNGPGNSMPVRYPNGNPLMSGWILGEDALHNQAAVADVDCGRGKIILFGFRPQNRGQSHGTFKLFFNAIYYGAAAAH